MQAVVKRRTATLVISLALVLVPAAHAGLPPSGIVLPTRAPHTTLHELGLQLYAGNCARCHGSNGSGVANEGPPLSGVGALAADFYLRTGYMPLARSARAAPPESRAFHCPRDRRSRRLRGVTRARAAACPDRSRSGARSRRGCTLFTQHCAGCHQIAAEGGYLTGRGRCPRSPRATPTQIAEAVRIGPYLMPQFSDERDQRTRQLDSIVAYVEHARRPADPGGWALGRVGPIPEGLIAWFVAGTAMIGLCLLAGGRLHR